MNYFEISNRPIIWLTCSITVVIAVCQALLYMKLAKKLATAGELAPELPRKALRIGLISAIGPAIGNAIVMVGLIANIGGPMSWERLSIIGAASTELAAAANGAAACGVTLGGPGYNLTSMTVVWFVMALNGAGWLLFTGLFTPSLEKIREKLSGGDIKRLGLIAASSAIGIFGFLCANMIVVKGPGISWGMVSATFGGAFSMFILAKYINPRFPNLSEYSLGIAMLIGITAGILYDVLFV